MSLLASLDSKAGETLVEILLPRSPTSLISDSFQKESMCSHDGQILGKRLVHLRNFILKEAMGRPRELGLGFLGVVC